MGEKKNLNFEDAIKKLEEIATNLEKNDLNLDDAVELFEEGTKLSKQCNDMLEKAEKKITILLNDGNNNFSEEEFKIEQ